MITHINNKRERTRLDMPDPIEITFKRREETAYTYITYYPYIVVSPSKVERKIVIRKLTC